MPVRLTLPVVSSVSTSIADYRAALTAPGALLRRRRGTLAPAPTERYAAAC